MVLLNPLSQPGLFPYKPGTMRTVSLRPGHVYDFIIIADSSLNIARISAAAAWQRGRVRLPRELTSVQFCPAEYSFGHARAVGPNHQIIFNYYEFIYPTCCIKWILPYTAKIYLIALSLYKGLEGKYERNGQYGRLAYVFNHLYLPVALLDVFLRAKLSTF
jgi:hypothetical protein